MPLDDLHDQNHVDEPDTDTHHGELDTGTDQDQLDTSQNHLTPALFEGDEGTLTRDQRECLHALLKQRYISADRHPKQWNVLNQSTRVIKSRLNDMFLDLHIEWGPRVAFKRRAVSETGEPLPSLLRDVAHTKEETIVMMALRERYFAQLQQGDDAVFIERQAMLEEIADRWPEHLTNRSAATNKAETGIEGLVRAGVLLRTDDPNRFQISPIIEVLLPIEKLNHLLAWLRTQNGTTPTDETIDEELAPGGLDNDQEDTV